MVIKLFQPSARNWLLIAEQLNDPETWDRFVPTHSPDSERSAFDRITIQTTGNQIKIRICKDLLRRGSSAYEYDWETDEETIISHAMQVAEKLKVNLEIGEPSQKTD